MKLNAAALMQPLSLAGFQNMHPPPGGPGRGLPATHRGAQKDLATITGFAACSLQFPTRAGEYSGLDGDPRLPPEPRSGLMQRGVDPGLGSRHQPGVGCDGGHEDRDGGMRRQRLRSTWPTRGQGQGVPSSCAA